jgi:oxygen-independent coproporphyrinogen-3 oxidase
MNKKLSIYIHIPFCVRKCFYCDFLSAPATRKRQLEYLAALKREIVAASVKYKDYEVLSVFFGGGTPSILEAADIEGVMADIAANYKLIPNVEVTIELNPKTADLEKLRHLKRAGINRLSIGLQSTDASELATIGRIHTYGDFLCTYSQAREVGFDNINIDLMSGLPGQSMESWVCTLERVFGLKPEHISAYSLIIEEGTRLFENPSDFPATPSEEEDRRMYQETKGLMEIHGYNRYEISNYAKAGFECRHNIVYWKRGNYVGFGIGASSMVENIRWRNTSDIDRYILASSDFDSIQMDIQKLSESDCMEEFMFLGLRMCCGVSGTDFLNTFGKNITDIYGGVLDKWCGLGMIEKAGDCYKLSDRGIDVSNVILADFLLG